MSDKPTKKKYIEVEVGFGDDNIPMEMKWQATDFKGKAACKAMLLSLFDSETRDTLKIDLWTKEMQVIEMDRFMYQTLRSLADTYMSATNNKELATAMRQFADYFGQQTEILKQ